MAKKRRRLVRRARLELVEQWPTLFLAVLLMFGPPPTQPKESDYEKFRDWREDNWNYHKTIRAWYFNEYLWNYTTPVSKIAQLAVGFVEEYKKWWKNQQSRAV